MINEHAAGTLNHYPNLIELIGRQSELLGTAMWRASAIGSDGDEPALNPLPDTHDNILQDANEAIGQDGVEPPGHEAIGQDGIEPPGHEAIGQDGIELLGHEAIGQFD
jgi:hypothetical protein